MTTHGVDRSGAAGGNGSATSPIDETIIDAKGDLIVGDASNSAVRLAVGTNGYMLVADSAQTEGMKWATLQDVLFTDTTAETSPATGDYILISDVSESPDAVNKMLLSDLFKVVGSLTTDTTPDPDADYLLIYDSSDGVPLKITPADLLSLAGGLAATGAEQETGTTANRVVVPANQSSHLSASKAWGTFDGTAGTPAFGSSSAYNCTTITDNGTGNYTITIATDFSGTGYACVAVVEVADASVDILTPGITKAAGSVTFDCENSAGAQADRVIDFACFGDR